MDITPLSPYITSLEVYFYQITFQRQILEVKSIKSEMASLPTPFTASYSIFTYTKDQFVVFVWFVCFSL